ncbi:MAG: hypothetical protein IKZ48_04780 [Prevotella sp.]|nr:hypothetical protein [Prevotella sp.]
MGKKQTVSSPKEKKQQAWLTEQRLRFYPLLLVLVALVAAFVVVLNNESEYLFCVEEMNLFLYTPLFFKQQLVVAGGLLTYLGTYFTQFLFVPWLGTLLLCLWCGLLVWLTKRTFCVSRWWSALLLVPIALVLLTDFGVGYWVYMLKLRGFFFITVIGLSMAVASVWAWRVLLKHVSRLSFPVSLLFMVFAAVVLYPLAGFYGLLAIVLMALVGWRLEQMTLKWKISQTVLALLLVFFVPLVFYRNVFYETNVDDIYRQALPLFESVELYTQYYWPYGLLCAFFILLAVFFRSEWSLRWVRKPIVWVLLQVLVIGGTVWGCWHYWYKDANFHRELQMDKALENCDWEGMLSIAASCDEEPTRFIWMYKNLALFRLGRVGDEMYNYRNGSSMPNAPFTVPMVVQGGKQLYLYYGLPNYCYRWCMEDGVEFGWRTIYLKYLTRSALVNGETTLAKKFIDLLKKTRYHREWAEHYEHFVTYPDDMKKDPELGGILPLLDHEDLLASDQSVVETFLLTLLSSQNTSSPLKSELAMSAALQQKDIPTFWRAFYNYIQLHPDGPMPRHYQEAAFMFGNLEKTVDISRMPFDPSIPATYKEFMQAAQQYAGMNEEQLAKVMRSRFGNTYYFDYFLMRGLKTY